MKGEARLHKLGCLLICLVCPGTDQPGNANASGACPGCFSRHTHSYYLLTFPKAAEWCHLWLRLTLKKKKNSSNSAVKKKKVQLSDVTRIAILRYEGLQPQCAIFVIFMYF